MLDGSNLATQLKTIPDPCVDIGTFTDLFATAYGTYAAMCTTGIPATPVVPASLLPSNLSSPIKTLTNTSTEEDFAKAFSSAIQLYWTPATFSAGSINASVITPPTKVLVKLPKDRAVEAASGTISSSADKIEKDVMSIPGIITTAAAGASSAAIAAANNSLQTDITAVSNSLTSILNALKNIPAKISSSSNFPDIGNAFSAIGTSSSSLISSMTNIASVISGFPAVLGSGVAANVSSALDPVMKDIQSQLSTISSSVSAGIANMTASSAQTVSLEQALLKGFLCNKDKDHVSQIEVLSKILHGCVKTGITSVINMSTGVAVTTIGSLGDPTDVSVVDLTLK